MGAANVDVDGDVARLLSAVLISTVVLLTWIYVARKSRSREEPFKNKYGPLILVLIGGFLMLMEPIRYELHDAGFVDIEVTDEV